MAYTYPAKKQYDPLAGVKVPQAPEVKDVPLDLAPVVVEEPIVTPPPRAAVGTHYRVLKSKKIPWPFSRGGAQFISLTEGDVIGEDGHGPGAIAFMKEAGVEFEPLK